MITFHTAVIVLLILAAVLIGFWLFVQVVIPVCTLIGLYMFFSSLTGQTLTQKVLSCLKRFVFKK